MNGFVLAGGQSTRMGRDKALLELNGRPLAALAVEKMRALGLDASICGVRPDLARFARVISDNFPQSGPVAGIEAGLTVSEADFNLFLPVDAPLVPIEFLHWMIARAKRSGAVATIPVATGLPQPLCAVYSQRLLAGLRAAILVGHRKMMMAVREAAASLGERVDLFTVESVAPALPAGAWPMKPALRDWFLNANTPEEFARLKQGQESRIA